MLFKNKKYLLEWWLKWNAYWDVVTLGADVVHPTIIGEDTLLKIELSVTLFMDHLLFTLEPKLTAGGSGFSNQNSVFSD